MADPEKEVAVGTFVGLGGSLAYAAEPAAGSGPDAAVEELERFGEPAASLAVGSAHDDEPVERSTTVEEGRRTFAGRNSPSVGSFVVDTSDPRTVGRPLHRRPWALAGNLPGGRKKVMANPVAYHPGSAAGRSPYRTEPVVPDTAPSPDTSVDRSKRVTAASSDSYSDYYRGLEVVVAVVVVAPLVTMVVLEAAVEFRRLVDHILSARDARPRAFHHLLSLPVENLCRSRPSLSCKARLHLQLTTQKIRRYVISDVFLIRWNISVGQTERISDAVSCFSSLPADRDTDSQQVSQPATNDVCLRGQASLFSSLLGRFPREGSEKAENSQSSPVIHVRAKKEGFNIQAFPGLGSACIASRHEFPERD